MIRFRIDKRSGLPAYRQLVDQVREALQLGLLQPGDQLPPVREVVNQIAINPNTVHRAYRELEHLGLTEGRTGQGTFIQRSLTSVDPKQRAALQKQLAGWIERGRRSGLGDEELQALFSAALREPASEAETA